MIPNLYDIETLHWKHWNTENCTLLANETQLLTKCNEGDERVLLITLIVLQMKGCLKIEVSFPASGIFVLIMIIVIIVGDDWSKGSHDYSFNPRGWGLSGDKNSILQKSYLSPSNNPQHHHDDYHYNWHFLYQLREKLSDAQSIQGSSYLSIAVPLTFLTLLSFVLCCFEKIQIQIHPRLFLSI